MCLSLNPIPLAVKDSQAPRCSLRHIILGVGKAGLLFQKCTGSHCGRK